MIPREGHRYAYRTSFVILLLLLLPSAGADSTIASPWPSWMHDSGATYAADPATPVFDRYCEKRLKLPLSESLFIPSPGIFVTVNLATSQPQPVHVYNKTSGKLSLFRLPPLSYVLGASSSMRLYNLNFDPDLTSDSANITAVSLYSGKLLWTQTIPLLPSIYSKAQGLYHTFTDAIDICWLSLRNQTCARYEGASGNLMWSQSRIAQANQKGLSELPQLGLPNGNLVSLADTALVSRDANTGKVVWSNMDTVSSLKFRLLAVADVITYADSTSVVTLNSTTGAQIWNSTYSSPFPNVPLAATLPPLTPGDSPSILIASQNQVLVFDAHTGAQRYEALSLSTASILSLVTVNQTVFMVTLSDTQTLAISTWAPTTRSSPVPIYFLPQTSTATRVRSSLANPYATTTGIAFDADGMLVSPVIGVGSHLNALTAPSRCRSHGIYYGLIGDIALGTAGAFVLLVLIGTGMHYVCRRKRKAPYEPIN